MFYILTKHLVWFSTENISVAYGELYIIIHSESLRDFQWEYFNENTYCQEKLYGKQFDTAALWDIRFFLSTLMAGDRIQVYCRILNIHYGGRIASMQMVGKYLKIILIPRSPPPISLALYHFKSFVIIIFIIITISPKEWCGGEIAERLTNLIHISRCYSFERSL